MKEKEEKKFLKSIQMSLRVGLIVFFILSSLGLIFKNGFLLSYGIIALVFTPIMRVIMLCFGFYRLKEYYMALASFGVLVLMTISLLI